MNSPFWYLWRNCGLGCSVISGGKDYLLGPGHYLLIPPFTSFSTSSHHQSMTQFHVHFTFASCPYRLRREPLVIPVDAVSHLIASDFFDTMRNPDIPSDKKEFWIYALIYALFGQLSSEVIYSEDAVPIHKSTRLFVEYMHRHFKDKSVCQDFCHQLNISAATLLRNCREDINMTPRHYLIFFRLAKAKNLLINSVCTLDEIAELTGFADRYHFSKLFSKYIHMPPAAFRRQASLPCKGA